MKRILTFIVLAILAISPALAQRSFYSHTVKTIDGQDFDFAQLKGKKVMIVNVASKCGFTKQYKELQELYEKYKDKNFVIIGFPANNFMSQEPGTNEEIAKFCKANYGVTFPMMAKISVKNEDAAPIYQWLTHKSLNKTANHKVTWNFQKFMIDEKGVFVGTLPPKTSPLDQQIIDWIESNKWESGE